MSAVRVNDQSKVNPVDLILNENKNGFVVISFPGAGTPWLVKPYDLLVGLVEASPAFTKQIADMVHDTITGYVEDHVVHDDPID